MLPYCRAAQSISQIEAALKTTWRWRWGFSMNLSSPNSHKSRNPPLLWSSLSVYFLHYHVRSDKRLLHRKDWQAATCWRQVGSMRQHMLPLNPPNLHRITIPPPSLSYNSMAPASLPASDTCGQKVTRCLIFHGPCTVGRVIQSESPQSACIYMKSSQSASVTSPALPSQTPPPSQMWTCTHTSCSQWVCGKKSGGAASFMSVKANATGNLSVWEENFLHFP